MSLGFVTLYYGVGLAFSFSYVTSENFQPNHKTDYIVSILGIMNLWLPMLLVLIAFIHSLDKFVLQPIYDEIEEQKTEVKASK